MNDEALYSYLKLSGPEYAYLGHFRSMEYICQGHNDSKKSDAENMDETVEQYGAGRLNSNASDMAIGA